MASGLGHLRFRCTGCGNCCRDLRVPLTHADVRRLADATGRAAARFVAWLPTHEVDLIGEPGSLVVLDHDAGHALMVLAQREGACVLLGSDERCTAYAARPGIAGCIRSPRVSAGAGEFVACDCWEAPSAITRVMATPILTRCVWPTSDVGLSIAAIWRR